MEHILEVKNLNIDLKTSKKSIKRLVENVSFSVGKKSSYGIVGESGCGKSITAMSVMGLLSYPLSVTNGEVNFSSKNGNINILNLSNNQMRKIRGNEISMIFQEPSSAMDPIFTIEDQIVEAMKFHTELHKKDMKDAVLKLLKDVGIPRAEKVMKEYPHQLSGGMLQRIMIAIALICKPKLLIADEPTTALDVTIQAQILDLMNNLKNTYDTSIIMITHDLGVIAETCENVAVFYAGQIVEEADIQTIFYDSKHPYTKGLLKSVMTLGDKTKKLYSIPGMVPAGGYISNGCRFEDRCQEKMDICKIKSPELKKISSGHKCRCWHYNESGDNNE